MKTSLRVLCIGASLLSLSSCTTDYYTPTDERKVTTYPYEDNYMPYAPQEYDDHTHYYGEERAVVVPETYHVGPSRAPTSHASIDKDWVKQQNQTNYTIELSEGDKAYQVAKTLYKAPKDERMAQIKYLRNGKPYYRGLYGTYPSPEAAKKALNALPDEVKNHAEIKTWGTVTEGMDE